MQATTIYFGLMSGESGTQESVTGRAPVTNCFSTDDLRLCVRESRKTQHLGLSPWLLDMQGMLGSPLIGQCVCVQLCVALEKRGTEELCNCRIGVNGQCLIVNKGQYKITADTCPRNALVFASALDCRGQNLPPYIGKLTIALPASISTVYLIKLKLVYTDPRLETLMDIFPREHLLHDIILEVATHTADIQHGDVQDTRSLSYLETPLRKLRLNGILLNNKAKRVILYFENLAEEGLKIRFEECQRRLNTIADQQPFLTDVVLVVLMEEGLMAYLHGDLREAENIYLDVCKRASRYSSTNYHFIVGRAHSRIASVYRKLGKLPEALEHLETSSQILECVSPCEHTSDNRYNMAAIYAEKLLRDGYTLEGEEITGKYFEESISHLRYHFQQYSETSNRGIRRVANKEIMLYLKADSSKAPDLNLDISQVSLARAGEKIEVFKRNLLPECPRRDKAIFYGLESDYLVHKRELSRGLERAKQCLSIAEELGLASELAGAYDRIKLIESLLIRQSINAF